MPRGVTTRGSAIKNGSVTPKKKQGKATQVVQQVEQSEETTYDQLLAKVNENKRKRESEKSKKINQSKSKAQKMDRQINT